MLENQIFSTVISSTTITTKPAPIQQQEIDPDLDSESFVSQSGQQIRVYHKTIMKTKSKDLP